MEFKNNARSTVADNPLAAGATTLNVAPGEGGNFPSSFPFLITIWDSSPYPGDDSEMEIVKCTGRTTDALTIVRAQEGTADVAHSNGEKVAMLLTAGHLSAILSDLATHEADTSTHGVTGTILGTEDRDVNDGVAGLDSNGNVLSKNNQVYAVRDVSDNIYFSERTSNEQVIRCNRLGVNNYDPTVARSGSWRKLISEDYVDAASGIAGLDANLKQVPAQHFVSAPAAANSTGTAGQMAYDANYFYLCYATDTWMRIAHSW